MPLLLGLGEEERALGAALDSGDADLVYLVLFRMQRTLPLQQFLAVLGARPAARALFTAYCAHMVALHPLPSPRDCASSVLSRVMNCPGEGGGGCHLAQLQCSSDVDNCGVLSESGTPGRQMELLRHG